MVPITLTARLKSLMPSAASPYNQAVMPYLHDFLNGCINYGYTTLADIRLELLRYTDDADVTDQVEDVIIALLEEYLDELESIITSPPFHLETMQRELRFKKFWFTGNIVGCVGQLEM